jgi:hypothetical protein
MFDVGSSRKQIGCRMKIDWLSESYSRRRYPLSLYQTFVSAQRFRRQHVLRLVFVFLLCTGMPTVLAQEPPDETPEASAESTQSATETITITGQVTNGTASGSVPPSPELTLFVFTSDFEQQQFQTTADEDGAYTFDDVPFQPDSTYVVTTAYRDHVFTTPLTPGSELTADPAILSVTIYELTEDPAVIEIAGMVTQVNVADDRLEFAQVFSLSNRSDRAFSTSQTTPDGRYISLVIPLPPAAIVAGFAEQGRYVFVQDDFTVLDTAPVLPGEEHIVQLIYFISYGDDAIIEQELNYRLNGPARLLVRPESVNVTSEQLEPRGPEVIGNAQYASYGAELDLRPGSVIGFGVSGQGGASAAVPMTEAIVTSDNLLPIALFVFGLTVAAVVGVLLVYSYRRRQTGTTSEVIVASQTVPRRRGALAREAQLIDILLEQIAELDSDFEAGKIAKDAYERQRAALKTRLSELMRKKQE